MTPHACGGRFFTARQLLQSCLRKLSCCCMSCLLKVQCDCASQRILTSCATCTALQAQREKAEKQQLASDQATTSITRNHNYSLVIQNQRLVVPVDILRSHRLVSIHSVPSCELMNRENYVLSLLRRQWPRRYWLESVGTESVLQWHEERLNVVHHTGVV